MFSFLKKSKEFWPQLKWQDLAILSSGLVVFVTLASLTVTKFSIWFDEAFGSYLIRFSYWDLTRYTAFDVHPPFYYWLLKTWSLIFGNTELGIRSMSIFFGAVTIVFAFLLLVRLFGRKAAYVSLIFLILSPMFIRYSQEARMYTLLTSIILAATYVLVYAREHAKKRWPWVTYGVLIAIGMLTQYFAALAWLSHWAWRFVLTRSASDSWKQTRKKFFTRQWVTAHIIGIVIFLPWLPFMIIQFATVQVSGFWILPLTSDTLPDFLTNFLTFSDYTTIQSWLALGFYVIVISTLWLIVKVLSKLKGEAREHYLLLLCMVVVPIILLVVASMPPLRPAFVDRYLMTSIVFLPMLIGVTIVLSQHMIRRAGLVCLGALVAVMMSYGVYTQSNVGNYNKSSLQSNNARQLVDTVRSKSTPGTPILSNTPWIFYESVMYTRDDSPIYFINETTEYRFGSLTMLYENDIFKIKDLDKFTSENRTFWVISNIKDSAIRPLRDSWHEKDSIIINDDVSKQPLLKATRFTTK